MLSTAKLLWRFERACAKEKSLLFRFFCLETKERNKEKFKAEISFG